MEQAGREEGREGGERGTSNLLTYAKHTTPLDQDTIAWLPNRVQLNAGTATRFW